MKKLIIICLAAMFTCKLFAQKQLVDSLVNVLETKKLTPAEKLDIYENICYICNYSDIQRMSVYAEKGLVLAENEKDKKRISYFNLHLGYWYLKRQIGDTAILYLNKALKNAVNEEQEAATYTAMAEMYVLQTNHALAIEYLMKALPVYEKSGDKYKYMKMLANIGGEFRTIGNDEKAYHYIKKANDIAKELNSMEGIAKTAMDIGILNINMGNFETALEFEYEALKAAQISGHKAFECAILQAISIIYSHNTSNITNNDSALIYAEKLKHVAEEVGYVNMIHGAMGTMASVYRELGRYKECEEIAMKAWAIDSTDLNVAPALAVNIIISSMRLGKIDKATSFFWKYTEMVNRYTDESYHSKITEMETKYETEKKDMQIQEFEKKRKLYILIIGVSIVAVLLVLAMLYFRQRLNKQRIKQLEQEKQLIASQAIIDGEAAERTRLARDLHDGLGGMLSVVKLNLKDMSGFSMIENLDLGNFHRAVEMLDKSIVELRRVSHHIMPDLSGGLKTPLEDFCRSIPEAHFMFFGDDSHLDNRLKITVYRCAHELINNAIKHARATAINVQLMIEGNLISLSVQDDGIGFAPEKVVNGLGLENIHARVAMYNGKVNIYSSPEKGGTEVNIEIELA